MKAIIHAAYGPPESLQLAEVDTPVPKDDEVLVRVLAASVNAADWHIMRGKPLLLRLMGFGVRRPKSRAFGLDFAGRVEAVGNDVKRFHAGDEVLGTGLGGFAEHVTVPESSLAPKPANLTFEQAAAVPVAAVTALQGLRDKGHLQPGNRVLIVGASGGVGSFAVQIAKALGAHVTAVCSTRNVETVRALGADAIIDYTRETFAQDGQRYELILVVNGYRPLSAYKHALRPNGRCVMIGGASMAQLLGGRLVWPFVSGSAGTKVSNIMGKVTRDDLLVLNGLLETGKVVPLVEARYPLSQVPAAMRQIETGHSQGKLVITLGPDSAN
jgi:NADPH:quinone reductase-like Zn-dependent oxidoreductase